MQPVVSFSEKPRTGTVWITHARRAALLSEIGDLLARRAGFTLATLNLDHCVKLRDDPAFRAAYLAHSHVVADGNPIVSLSRMAGRDVDLIPGSELITPLAEIAARADAKVALLGATPATLEAAAAGLTAKHPGLRVVARIAPPMGFDAAGPQADALIAELEASGAGLCFLALGAPKQEIFAARAQTALPGCGFVSIGAGLDFIAGSQTRAPRWVRRAKLEWLWRMLSNPRRLMLRYGRCVAILPGLIRQARREGRPS